MTELTPATANPGSLTLSRMSIEDLKAELARVVRVTAAHLAHLAAIWRELERRGEDMSAMKSGLWTYMPAIASGDLLPELVVKYAGYTGLLGRLARLPLADQHRIMEDDRVTVVSFADGDWVEETKPLAELRATQLAQVVRERIVPPAEQRRRALASADGDRAAAASKPGTLRDRAIRTAQRERRLPGLSARVMTQVPMTPGEREQLEAAAAEGGVPLARLIRAALVNAGLLG